MVFVRWLIWIHKWTALVIGTMIMLWVAGGVAMSVIPLTRVHGDHHRAPTPHNVDMTDVMAPGDAAERAGLAVSGATLRPWLDRVVYEFTTPNGSALVDGRTGQLLSPIDEDTAIAVAEADYLGEFNVAAVEFFAEPSWEYRRSGPAWRISIDDGDGTRLYVSTQSGAVTARRNNEWRIFDFFWALHIMNFGDRENFNTWWLIGSSLLALISSIAGVALLVPWVGRMIGRRRRRRVDKP